MTTSSRSALACVAIVALLAGLGAPVAARPSAEPRAPGAPGADTVWLPANSSGFATSRTDDSLVWFTLQRGRVGQVFYPDLGTPSARTLELVVSDGRTFTDRESTDMRHVTRLVESRSLTYRQVNTDKERRYRLVKTVVTDPSRSTVLVDVRLESLDGQPYRLFAVYDPALGNDGQDDNAHSRGGTLLAHDDEVASALIARPRFGRTSSGYLGSSDGWTDLRGDHRMDWSYRTAPEGNVVQTARMPSVNGLGAQHASLALGFGSGEREALRAARGSIATGFDRAADEYADGWHGYLRTLSDVPSSAAALAPAYLASVLVVAASEDKQNPGAFVASPTMPWVWGDTVPDLSEPSGAYHLVWSRDVYQFATALLAAGDEAAADRAADFLFHRQQLPDGSFPQNSTVTAQPEWTGLQLDEVALPIVLAWQLNRTDLYAGVRKAADFLVEFEDPATGHTSPWSPQDRWENESGYSPATIAAQIAGLVCAADLARQVGDHESARRWLAVADAWQRNVEEWTVTTNGPLSDEAYYLRLTKDGRPNQGTTYSLSDGGPVDIDQRRVVDPSFLELVRLGIKPADDPAIVSSLEVIDEQLKVQTPNGAFWHRYTEDGYGEKHDGSQWVITPPGADLTIGRVWPLLTGERGEYALAAGRSAREELAAMARAGNSGRMIAEQVWGGQPPTGRPRFQSGEGTFSATPLAWSHSQLIRLAWSMQAGHPVEQPDLVACRYVGGSSAC